MAASPNPRPATSSARARASGQLAAKADLWDDVGGIFVPRHLAVLTLRGALIDEIDAFIDPSVPLLGPAGGG
jgi:hypothetical protein